MTQIDPKNSNSNDGNISILKEKFEKVKSDIDLIGTEVDGEVADLSTWKTEADKVVKEAKRKGHSALAASVDAKRELPQLCKTLSENRRVRWYGDSGIENFKGKITPTISGCLTNLKDIDFAGGRVIKLGTLSTKGHVGEWLKNNLQSSSGLNGAFKSLGQDNESILQSIFNVLKVENIVNGQRDVTFFKALDEDIHNAIKDIINLKNLSDPMQSLRTELNGDGLHRAVSGITVKVKDLTDQVNQQAESSLIDGYFDGIWNALDDLCSGVQNLVETTGNGGIKKDGVNPRLNELEKGLQTTKLRDSKNGLHDIHAHLGQLQIRIAEVTKADASTKVADIIAELEGLPELLNRKRSDAEGTWMI
ncbi:phage SPP1 structural protein, putative [Babesia ovata]|uniref:Phage SPP1 structural protein, putative n=1 Tax=Babesia ovata TaxID=189622 RepID=A0A2H6KKI3_9APIC|nr:phage SPP1 structural protein, putative [Babesia ovata]GBE63503.1 phage SPP1 structural protein, putative [Babesia ovata]